MGVTVDAVLKPTQKEIVRESPSPHTPSGVCYCVKGTAHMTVVHDKDPNCSKL